MSYRFLIDEQLPPLLVRWLDEKQHQASHVYGAGLEQTSDRLIAVRASREGWIILTKDDDFREPRVSNGARVVWLGCGNIANAKLLLFLEPRWQDVLAPLERGLRLVEIR